MIGKRVRGRRRRVLVFIAWRRRQRGFSQVPRVSMAGGTRVGRVCALALGLIAWRVGRVFRIAVVFIGRGTGVSGVSFAALISVARRSRMGGVSRVSLVSIGRRTGVTASTGITWVSIPRWRGGRISILTRIPVSRKISVGWVAVIGARWRRRCGRDASEYP